MFKFLFLAILLTSTIGNPINHVQQGAFEQKDLQFSYIIQIGLKNDKSSYSHTVCGGVVINNDTIISAAHCFYHTFGPDEGTRKPFSMFEIVLPGTKYPVRRGPIRVAIKDIVVHPQYNFKSKANDIVKIVTSSSLTQLGIQPLQLADKDFNPSGEAMYVNHRHQLPVQILPQNDCNALFLNDEVHYKTRVEQHQICGIESGETSTLHFGDSGGPLICKNKNSIPFLCGIFSRGFPDRKDLPDIYTNVSSFLVFIYSKDANHRQIEQFINIYKIEMSFFLIGFCLFAYLYYRKSRRMLLNENEPKLLKLNPYETVNFENEL